jgi:hypothetical protein
MPRSAAPPVRKLDPYKDHKAEYVAPKEPALVNTTKAKYLTCSGQGEPGGDAFQNAIAALYTVAYAVKMTKKLAEGVDYKVCTLEALYDLDPQTIADRKSWKWKLMIRIPDFIQTADLKNAVKQAMERGKSENVMAVKLESLSEGKCVQILHVGPYDQEEAACEKMKQFAESCHLHFRGLHHEIYLSDPRRIPPERLRTILRHPVAAN